MQPVAVACSPDGNLFVLDKTGRIQRFDSQGKCELTWEVPDNDATQLKNKPDGLCADHLGRVLLADTHQSRVVIFDRDGHELFRFGQKGMGAGQFMLPTDVAVDSKGMMYVGEFGGNERVSKFDSEGRFLLAFGDLGAGTGSLQRPSGLAIDSSDHLWVVDTGNHRVCCFDGQGRFVRAIGQLGSEPGRLRYPRDVAFVSNDVMSVVEEGNHRVSFFDTQGKNLAVHGGIGHGFGEFDSPIGISVNQQAVYVADMKNDRIQSWQWSSCLVPKKP